MLKSLHFLLTYQCLFECDHCFLYCGPKAEGTFTLAKITDALDQAVGAGVEGIEIEGGEPFLFYPLMLETLRQAKNRGLTRGIVTNCYWATSLKDARLWLEPLVEVGLDSLAVSDDRFHSTGPMRRTVPPSWLFVPRGTWVCLQPASALRLRIPIRRRTANRVRRWSVGRWS